MFKLQTERWGDLEVDFVHRNPAMGWALSVAGTSCGIGRAKNTKQDNTLYYAVAMSKIHPLDIDSYCKEQGRKMSLKRALKVLGANREERLQFWNAYFETQETAREKAKENSK